VYLMQATANEVKSIHRWRQRGALATVRVGFPETMPGVDEGRYPDVTLAVMDLPGTTASGSVPRLLDGHDPDRSRRASRCATDNRAPIPGACEIEAEEVPR
jgi:hypothetical protein